MHDCVDCGFDCDCGDDDCCWGCDSCQNAPADEYYEDEDNWDYDETDDDGSEEG